MSQMLLGADPTARHLKIYRRTSRSRSSIVTCSVCGKGLPDEVSLTARREREDILFFCPAHL